MASTRTQTIAPRTPARGVPRRTETGSPAKGKRLGIGARMAELLTRGLDTAAILKHIHREFPASRATGHDVSIIRRRVASMKPRGPAKRPPRGSPIH